jgi:hypothetical protein
MKVLFKTRDPQAQTLRDWVQARTVFALRRMAKRLSYAAVQMTDIDGDRNGVGKRCQVTFVPVQGGTPVVVSATARDWRAALNQALARALQAFRRLFERTQQRVQPRLGMN